MMGAFALGIGPASAEDPPSEQDVTRARQAVSTAASNVAGIQTQLVLANQRADDAWVASAQAAEAYNGAQYEAGQAAAEATSAARALAGAQRSAGEQKASYGKTLVDQIQSGGNLQGVSVLLQTDGLDLTVQRAGAWQNVQDAMDGHWRQYQATATVASVSEKRATKASARAAELAAEADSARVAAEAAAASASAEAEAVASQRDALIQELARLQDVSVQVADQRQQALEAAAAERAAQVARAEAEARAEQDATTAQQPEEPTTGTPPSAEPSTQPSVEPSNQPSNQPSTQAPSRPATPPSREPVTTPNTPRPSTPTAPPSTRPTPPTPAKPTPTKPPATPAPAPARGAQAAIAFAKKQLGEPYVWAAAGPNSWDCSGLMVKAWAAGGKSLPHWSVGQYRASTPIKVTQLQPGDLVFWGSSNNSSSIYHVAMYLGNDQMIHAPRPGKGVTVESMYYWRTPNFFARP